MARIEVIICDRCGLQVDSDHAGGYLHIDTTRYRSPWFNLDFCGQCTPQVEKELRRRNTDALPKNPGLVDDPNVGRINTMKETALQGIDLFNDGATANQLAQVLRDVISEGKRHA
jgi:hypothetical protein